MIPEAAVEAALDAWGARGGLSPEAIVRNILEAAAPHMLREAWDDGIKAGIRCDGTHNPYRPAK